jgi:hypothetical protein
MGFLHHPYYSGEDILLDEKIVYSVLRVRHLDFKSQALNYIIKHWVEEHVDPDLIQEINQDEVCQEWASFEFFSGDKVLLDKDLFEALLNNYIVQDLFDQVL